MPSLRSERPLFAVLAGVAALLMAGPLAAKCATQASVLLWAEMRTCNPVVIDASPSRELRLGTDAGPPVHVSGTRRAGALVGIDVLRAQDVTAPGDSPPARGQAAVQTGWRLVFIEGEAGPVCPDTLPRRLHLSMTPRCCDTVPAGGDCILPVPTVRVEADPSRWRPIEP